jgi:hypothetical protein
MRTLPKDEIGYESGVWPVLESPAPPDRRRIGRRLLWLAAVSIVLAASYLSYFYL